MNAAAAGFDGVPPAFIYRPPRVGSLLSKVEQVCRTVGRDLEPEQALAVDVLTGVRADGTPASLSACVISARQNLKTYVLENIVLTRLLDPTDPGRLFIWTAQQLDTCQETFLHFKDMFESDDFPHLQRRLVNIANGHGDEEIELVGGKRLKFKARSKKSGQGLTGDLIVLDEAFAVEPAHLGSLVPTLSTRPRAAILYGSSAGHGSSEVLRGVRDRGRRGGPGSPAYIEWCAPGSLANPGCAVPGCSHLVTMQGCVLDRRELIQLANPMAGRRISWDYLRDERRELPPLEYARERLGWWDEPDSATAPPISVDDWRHQLDPESAVAEGGKIVLAAEIAMDRRSGSIGVAGWRDDGTAHVGLIWHQQGTDQLLPALLGFRRAERVARAETRPDTVPGGGAGPDLAGANPDRPATQGRDRTGADDHPRGRHRQRRAPRRRQRPPSVAPRTTRRRHGPRGCRPPRPRGRRLGVRPEKVGRRLDRHHPRHSADQRPMGAHRGRRARR